MDSLKSLFLREICGRVNLPWETILFIIVELALLSFIAFITFKFMLRYPRWYTFVLLPFSAIVTFIISGAFVLLLFFIIFLEDGRSLMRYFDLNAAIKNTCFLDPYKNHCPANLNELIAIEPQKFIPLTKGVYITTYDFRPSDGRYTLIVREGERNAIVFDPRLKEYYSGLDSVQFDVDKCGGNYRLTSPPNIPGPWNKIN